MRSTRLVVLIGVAALAVVATLFFARSAPVPTIAATEMGAFGFAAGELVPEFSYKSINSGRGTLESLLEGKRGLVVALRTVECPVSQKYGHKLRDLEEAYAAQGIGFAYLDVSPQDSPEDMEGDIATFGYEAPYIADPEGVIGNILQAAVSTEVFLIDESGTLRYRGAIDDQFGITFSKPVIHQDFLVDAIDQMLAGEDIEISETEASGCYLEMAEQPVPQRAITYHNRVSRIVQENCVTCHRDGGVAPMPLDSYEQVDGFSEMIKFVVSEGTMPPWFATQDHGVFKNDMRLSDRDKRDLLAWIEDGKPEGSLETGPAPRVFAEGWMLEREPDAIVRLPEPQDVPARGVLDYRYVTVPTDFDTDVWIQSAEVRPTAAQVTHHVIAYYANEEEEENRGRGDFFMGWAPGMPPVDYPDGSAKLLKKGQPLRFELHYTPNGTQQWDQTEIALVFANQPPTNVIHTSAVSTSEFEIPPHAENHEVVAEQTFRRGATILSMLPHMHLRGKAFRIEHIKADGSSKVVLDVPRYDFNWQLWYEFAEPLRIEAGETLRGIAWYDNSSNNPWNPDPDSAVRYGEQTFEEMMFGFYDFMRDPAPAEPAQSTDDGID